IFPKTQSAPNNFNTLPAKIGFYCRTWVRDSSVACGSLRMTKEMTSHQIPFNRWLQFFGGREAGFQPCQPASARYLYIKQHWPEAP
ncbi:MAG: hypothetical protein ABSA09_08560, partial [Desulfobaccales bacterium]